MNTPKQRSRFVNLLKALFQLDQPDLDFGLYRIMHAKSHQVSRFLEEDLLKIIQDAFGEADEAKLAEAQAAYEAAKKQAADYGAPDPDATPPVMKAKAALDAVRNAETHEGDVYDHLYRFFERYYDAGDFMSRRYFARETDGKAAPYAVPYDGREVYLHWANRDQYYIKTSEYLTNFTFDPTKAPEYPKLDTAKPMNVHCRIVSASEGEHNNVKASEQTERFFLIHEAEPVKLETGETGEPELVLQFEYRADPKKSGQSGAWAKKRLEEAAETIKAALPNLAGAEGFTAALMTPAPTEKQKERTLLEKYLAQYTARNTMDYFIHKDLGGFLRRELDFYIKNEIMRLDDIEAADAPQVEGYLARVKVLRRIARHLIDFLAQLEDFQKKLWLKKKFVTDTQYCITLDRIPDDFYPEIAANEAQREEWVRLFAIDELDGYSAPLTVPFLKANDKLLIDTALFGSDFRDRVVTEMEGLDGNLAGVATCAENGQALRTMKAKIIERVGAIYIDPPYNTDASSIIYKNGYKSSSWLSLIQERLLEACAILSKEGVICVAIDDEQMPQLSEAMGGIFATDLGKAVVRSNPQSRKSKTTLSPSHEYALFYGRSSSSKPASLSLTDKRLARYPLRDERGHYSWMSFIRTGTNELRSDRPKMHFPIVVDSSDQLRIPKMSWCAGRGEYGEYEILEEIGSEEVLVYPVSERNGERVEKRWHRGWERVLEDLTEYRVRRNKDNEPQIDFKTRIDENSTPSTWWDKPEYASANYGAIELKQLFSDKPFDFPKAVLLVEDCIQTCASGLNAEILDFFAGSGTTAHAVINLNRKDGGGRRFTVIEMGTHFDSVLLPRTKKAAYSCEWKDGKPVSRDGLSHAFKYLRLESYEDALNNLALRPAPDLTAAGETFRRDYMLKYWLDFETKGSPSLLNIQTFDDPTDYRLNIKTPGTDEYTECAVDLVETFNWLIGLHVEHLDRWRGFDATFKREPDPELPKDETTRLILDGKLTESDTGKWRFRKVEGYTLTTPGDDTSREKTLVIWRVLTGNLEEDNLMLDEWFHKYRLSTQDTEFDVIYVNGSNNLPNLRQEGESWKVRLLEEAFHQAMWDVEG
ncbi:MULTISPECIES: DNA methyltransferase [Henriciella]|jgi:adenine-specific DNA-methyltransferase|uniref:DNA methyltransferase n=1 Tax=Henriciella TaxID=453849 RepID=UPI003515889E